MTPDGLHAAPTIEELLEAPHSVSALPPAVARDLTAACDKLLLRVQGLRDALLVHASGPPAVGATDSDLLVGSQGVAVMVGRSKSWVEHHVDQLPPRRSLIGQPVWVKSEIEEWIQGLPAYGD